MNTNNQDMGKQRRENNQSNNSGNRLTLRDQRNAWKQERAKEPDTLIIKASSERVVALINILPNTDYAMRRLQNRIGIDIDMKEAEKIFEEWNKIVLTVHDFTEKYSQLVNARYPESAAVKRIKNTVIESQDSKDTPPTSSAKKVKGG